LTKASGNYVFKKSDKSTHSSEQMAAYWTSWVEKYPIVSIEDGMAEDELGWLEISNAIRWHKNQQEKKFS